LLLEQGYCTLPAGLRMSSTGRTATYERAIAWKVLDDNEAVECIAFVFMNWSFVTWKTNPKLNLFSLSSSNSFLEREPFFGSQAHDLIWEEYLFQAVRDETQFFCNKLSPSRLKFDAGLDTLLVFMKLSCNTLVVVLASIHLLWDWCWSFRKYIYVFMLIYVDYVNWMQASYVGCTFVLDVRIGFAVWRIGALRIQLF